MLRNVASRRAMTVCRSHGSVVAKFAAVFLLSINGANAQDAPNAQSLQNRSLVELATELRPGFLLGAHASWKHMPDQTNDSKPRDLLAREYNLISVGIYQKSTQRNSQHDWNFSSVDSVVNFASQNDLKVYAHPMTALEFSSIQRSRKTASTS